MNLLPQHTDVPLPQRPSRGVGWVLRQAAAMTVFFVVAIVLWRFGYLLSAEKHLAQAAAAGAYESTLPCASLANIRDVVRRRLGGHSATHHVRILVTHNGAPVRGSIQPQPGDALSVLLWTSSHHVLPDWLACASGWLRDRELRVRANQRFSSTPEQKEKVYLRCSQ